MTNFVVWIVLGTVWRFSTAGSIASGSKLEKPVGMTDESWSEQIKTAQEQNGYQLKHGLFMQVIIVLVFTLLGVFLVGSTVGFFVLRCYDPRSKRQEYEELEDNEADQQQDH